MSFDARPKEVRKLFTKASYVIPRNQRDYIWDQIRWEELFNDLLFITNNLEEHKNHFIGSFVLKDRGSEYGVAKLEVVDGQQRLATILILLCALQRIFHSLDHDKEFYGLNDYLKLSDDNKTAVDIINSNGYDMLNSLINEVSEEDKAICLMQDSKQLCRKLAMPKKFSDCFVFFSDKLKATFNNDNEALVKFRDVLLSTQYIEIVAKDDEDSYTIFEILNARGKPLGDSELLKNYIMRYILPKDNRDKVEYIWREMHSSLGGNIEKFIKNYACHKFGYSRSKTVNGLVKADSSYKAIRDNVHTVFGDDAINKLLKDLQYKAKLYAKIIDTEKDFYAKDAEGQLLYLLKISKNEQYRPLIMSLMHQRDNGNIQEETYLDIIDFLYKFHICYTIICNGTTNKLERIIYSRSVDIENNYNEISLEKLVKNLKDKLPDKKLFLINFKQIGYSHHKNFFDDESNKNQVVSILRIYENFLGSVAWQLDFTIEHILPDSNGSQNAIIGNLVPLEKKINEKVKDWPIEEKLVVYGKESAFASVRKFADRYGSEPGEFSPEKRTEHMAKLFYKDILKMED